MGPEHPRRAASTRRAATWRFSASAIHESRRGGLWVGGQGGVARFTNGRFEELAGAARDPAERVVTTLLEDSAGRLWTGTRVDDPALLRLTI